MESLLGQFYSRIRGSQEDIASEGLTFIFHRSENAKVAIKNIVKHECGISLPDLSYHSQSSGDNLERPDISGSSDNGKECIIIEAKFWASLTDNQPNEYLKRLPEHSVLLFICPHLRIRSLWDELKKRISDGGLDAEIDETKHLAKLKDEKYLIIKSWSEMLEAIKYLVAQENNSPVMSDIDQIIGFCETIDNDTFLPITSDELSPSLAKRISSYYHLSDKLIDELKKKIDVNLKGLNKTGQAWGYTRYCRIYDFGVSIDVNFKYWSVHADTPFWVGLQEINENKWVKSSNILVESCKKAASQLNINMYLKDLSPYFPVYPVLNEPEEIVLKKMADQIVNLINTIKDIKEKIK
jgi:hypothetical protein